jgi:hypothetical protein
MSATDALQPWDVLSSVPLLSAPPWLEISRQEVRLPGGQQFPVCGEECLTIGRRLFYLA